MRRYHSVNGRGDHDGQDGNELEKLSKPLSEDDEQTHRGSATSNDGRGFFFEYETARQKNQTLGPELEQKLANTV